MTLKAEVGKTASGEVRLVLRFEGETPALKAHRLSVAEFREPLWQLLVAYRRIASGLISEAVGDPEYGKAGGKYAEQAKSIDLEIDSLKHDSPVEVGLVCRISTPLNATYQLFEDGFLVRAGEELIRSLAAESKGELRNAAVRKYLKSLPERVKKQDYVLWQGDKQLGVATINNLNLSTLPDVPSLPYLQRITGTIVGVGFEPGPFEVRISDGTSIKTLSATQLQVEASLKLREEPVIAMIVQKEIGARLIWVRHENTPIKSLSHADTVKYVSERWDEVLKRLGQ